MPPTDTTPTDLRPRELWRLKLQGGHEAFALLGSTAEHVKVVWFLDDMFQEAAEFENADEAEHSAENVRRMLTTRS
jgi:hypothetical protein